ncbi:MAG: hypothetical protein ACHP7N_01240 [Caulobacterales bacterium]
MGAAFLGEKAYPEFVDGLQGFSRSTCPGFVDFYLSGKLKLDEMISRRIRLEDVNEAFAEMKTGRIARSVIVFDA